MKGIKLLEVFNKQTNISVFLKKMQLLNTKKKTAKQKNMRKKYRYKMAFWKDYYIFWFLFVWNNFIGHEPSKNV